MKVTVDQDECVSSGQCALNDSPPPEQATDARKAAACPALAIDIEE
jgi:ferredoxin